MQTLRRLRLQRAFDVIGQGKHGRFTDVGFNAGYGSSAAFTHAFRKQFGISPSDVPSILRPAIHEQPIDLIYLPKRKVWQYAYEGEYAQNGWPKAHLVWQCHDAGRGDLLAWRVNDRDTPFSELDRQRVKLVHFIPSTDIDIPLDAELATQPGGWYAVTERIPTERHSLLAEMALRVRTELGCQIIDGHTLDREPHERCFRVPQERRVITYIPVVPISQKGRRLCCLAKTAAERKF